MADISKITLPGVATPYGLKDNSQSKSDHRHYSSDVVPIVHKLYESTSYYATAANQGASTWYVASIRPDSWYLPWKIRFKFHTYCPDYPAYESVTYSMITGRSTGVSYANWNEIQTTAHYYINIQPLTAAGFNAGYGFAIGVGIYAATDYTKAAYYRSFEVDFLECENCTVNVLDTPVKWADWPGTGTTNYGTLVSTNGCTRGLQETGDTNTVTENRIGYFAGKTGVRGVWAGSLFMEDGAGKFQNICMGSDATETSLGTRTVNATKIPNSNGFKVGSSIWYPNTAYAANTNISGSSVVYSSISIFDSRYSLNTSLVANSLIPYNLLYLVGTIHDDNLYYLDDVWWTQTPNDPNKVYVLVGSCFDSTTSYCRITLYEQNKWYRYDGTNLVEFTYGATTLVSKGSMLPIGNTAPYLFRQSGGDNNALVGTEETDKLVGASAVVNQLAGQHGRNVSLTNFNITYDSSTNSFTAVGTPEATGFLWLDNTEGIANHVYYGHSSNPNVGCGLGGGYSQGQDAVRKVTTNATMYVGIIREIKAYNDTFKLNIVDLTAMFGTTIADYIYSLEQATAGSGIAYLRKYGFFTKDYYPYTANTLQSVNTSKHITTGKNLFDKSTLTYGKFANSSGVISSNTAGCMSDYIKVIPNHNIQVRVLGNDSVGFYSYSVIKYDENKNFISRSHQYPSDSTMHSFTLPSDCKYIIFQIALSAGSTITEQNINDGEIMVSLASLDGDIAYEPYSKHEYALPNIDLRGLYKLDASNNLYADGDTLEGDGTLTRKYTLVNLGSLPWTKSQTANRFQAPLPLAKKFQNLYTVPEVTANLVCPLYTTIGGNTGYAGTVDKAISGSFWNGYNYLQVNDSGYSDAQTFKTAMSGVYLIYERATPTTEQATGFTNPQLVDKYGTEEYTDERDFPLPVGHETVYLSELYGDREKLDSLPNRANADGTYAVSQTLGQMTLVPTSEISVGDAETVNGHTVESNVPSNAVFTDTTYTGAGLISIDNNNVISTSADVNYYGTCTDSSSTVAKTATLVNGTNFSLTAGVTIRIKFDNYNSATNPTLNVENTGAIAIKRCGTTAIGKSIQGSWANGAVVTLTYDGTNWVLNNSNDSVVGDSGYSHAEGIDTEASGIFSHAEGSTTQSRGDCSHAEGYRTAAANFGTHSEGIDSIATGQASHAEGGDTYASGNMSHAEGQDTTASGVSSHAEGYKTTAQRKSQHVFGEYNILDTEGTTTTHGDYVEIVGNGTGENARSNARTLDWSGNETLAGSVTATGGFVGNLTGDASTVNSHTVETDVPSNAVFTDTWRPISITNTSIGNNNFKINPGDGIVLGSSTSGTTTTMTIAAATSESLPAASGGTDLSLVTTGEKDAWNNKSNASITISGHSLVITN